MTGLAYDIPRRGIGDTDGKITTIVGVKSETSAGTEVFSDDGGLTAKTQLSGPTSVTIDNRSCLYIAEFGNNRVSRVAIDG